MKSILISSILMLATTTAIAATNETSNKQVFNIASKLYIDGKFVSSPNIIAHANQPATISITNKDGSTLKMEILTKDVEIPNLKNTVSVHYDIQYTHAGEAVHYNPTLLLLLNKESRLKVFANAGHSYELSVLVK